MKSQKGQNDFGSFPRQSIQYHSNQVYAITTNAKDANVEWFDGDLLELTPKRDVLSIIGDWNQK